MCGRCIPGEGYKLKLLAPDFVTIATTYGVAIPCPCEEGNKFTVRTLGDFPCARPHKRQEWTNPDSM